MRTLINVFLYPTPLSTRRLLPTCAPRSMRSSSYVRRAGGTWRHGWYMPPAFFKISRWTWFFKGGCYLKEVLILNSFSFEGKDPRFTRLKPGFAVRLLQIKEYGLRTSGEEIAFTARPKIKSQFQILKYGQSIFCLPHRPKISDFFDVCLHWLSMEYSI